jgi:hypothetical protein
VQEFSLPVLLEETPSGNPFCSEFIYSLIASNESDVDLLFTIDNDAGVLQVEPYSSRATLDHTYSGTYEYTLLVQSPHQVDGLAIVEFSIDLQIEENLGEVILCNN